MAKINSEWQRKATGSKNPNWKGDDVTYIGLHSWVWRNKGRPKKCEHCGTTTAKRFEWANKSHEYKRDLTDWIRLCTSCHKKYDMTPEILKFLRKPRINGKLIKDT